MNLARKLYQLTLGLSLAAVPWWHGLKTILSSPRKSKDSPSATLLEVS